MAPLHYAARRGHEDFVEVPIQNGADVNLGIRPVHLEYNKNEEEEMITIQSPAPALHLQLHTKYWCCENFA